MEGGRGGADRTVQCSSGKLTGAGAPGEINWKFPTPSGWFAVFLLFVFCPLRCTQFRHSKSMAKAFLESIEHAVHCVTPTAGRAGLFFLLYEYPSIALADMYNKYLGSWRASHHGREGRVAAGRLRDEYSN